MIDRTFRCTPLRLYAVLTALLLSFTTVTFGQVPFSTDTIVTAPAATVHARETLQFAVTRNGVARTDGYWYSNGTGDAGSIDASSGLYRAPQYAPSPTTVTIGYYMSGVRAEMTISVTNPRPQPGWISATSFTQVSTPITIRGSGFLPGSVISVQGKAIPTTYLGQDWLTGTVVLSPVSGNVPITVTNPDPGSSSATITVPAVFPGINGITPTTVTPGWVTFTIAGTGYTASSAVSMDGRPMQTKVNSATSLTATGYLPPWRGAKTTTITVTPQAGSASSSSSSIPVTAAALSYDVAARFSTQAAFGPRPGLVEHIQQVGLAGFVKEQMALPGVTYTYPTLPRYPYLLAVASGNSLLRLRVAMALQSFIVNQANSQEFQSYAPWETKLEADAFGNFRQLMTDIVSDASITTLLNLPGNNANMGAASHPNQNFSRELMQLFTLGTAKLNDDGSFQLDASGNVIPTYDQNTIVDLSRAFTGWNYGTPVNANYMAFNIDYSQPLMAIEQYHDHGAKTLFGTVNLPAGQTAATDRTAALNAIFNHANLPPFIATRLIRQLVKSNPTPAYISRISAVFKNNGKGVRGDLSAVVTAILLDPEARAGDTTTTVGASEGYLQDPLLFEAFVMNVLQQTQFDGQPTYLPGKLGEDFWHPNSVFGFYPASYLIPGTTINSPQYSLLNNLTQLHRSQYLYGMISGQTSGFGSSYQATAWLYTAFTNVPDLVDGLNHQLFHGTMPAATQSEIVSYCSGISNLQQAFTSAIFLAMNSDSYNVVH